MVVFCADIVAPALRYLQCNSMLMLCELSGKPCAVCSQALTFKGCESQSIEFNLLFCM